MFWMQRRSAWSAVLRSPRLPPAQYAKSWTKQHVKKVASRNPLQPLLEKGTLAAAVTAAGRSWLFARAGVSPAALTTAVRHTVIAKTTAGNEVMSQLWVKLIRSLAVAHLFGGEGGIRTPGTVSRTAVFKTACFNHSHTSPFIDLRASPSDSLLAHSCDSPPV